MGIDRYFEDQEKHRLPFKKLYKEALERTVELETALEEKTFLVSSAENRVRELELAITRIRDHNYINPKENFFITDICEDVVGTGDMDTIAEKIKEIGEMGGYK